MPRCQHEHAVLEIELLQQLSAQNDTASRAETTQIKVSVKCPACAFSGYYRAYPAGPLGKVSGNPAHWPRWLLKLITALRATSPAIDAACVDRNVPGPEGANVTRGDA